jgi:hypothetical protein
MAEQVKDKTPCPDCGCPVWRHNAVNSIGIRMFAHCGDCGLCWKSTPEFAALVKADIDADAAITARETGNDG